MSIYQKNTFASLDDIDCINHSTCTIHPHSIPVFVIVNESEFNEECKRFCVSDESEPSESCLCVRFCTSVGDLHSFWKSNWHDCCFFHCIGWWTMCKDLCSCSTTSIHVKFNADVTINSPFVDELDSFIKIQSLRNNLDDMIFCGSESEFEDLICNLSHPPIFCVLSVFRINSTNVFVCSQSPFSVFCLDPVSCWIMSTWDKYCVHSYGILGSKFATSSSYFCIKQLYLSSYWSSEISQECSFCISLLISLSIFFVSISTYAYLSIAILLFMRWYISECSFISHWKSSEILSCFQLVKCFFLHQFYQLWRVGMSERNMMSASRRRISCFWNFTRSWIKVFFHIIWEF